MEIDGQDNGSILLANTLASFKTSLAEALDAKRTEADGTKLKQALTNSVLSLIDLRRLSRNFYLAEDKVKAETDAAKIPLDKATLQLNNLLYERDHFLREIQACREFKTKFPGIDLESESAFWAAASGEQKSDAKLRDDPHQLELARLQLELTQVNLQTYKLLSMGLMTIWTASLLSWHMVGPNPVKQTGLCKSMDTTRRFDQTAFCMLQQSVSSSFCIPLDIKKLPHSESEVENIRWLCRSTVCRVSLHQVLSQAFEATFITV
jgi:hypothetical protein